MLSRDESVSVGDAGGLGARSKVSIGSGGERRCAKAEAAAASF